MNALFDILEQVKEIDPRARVLITSYKFNPDFFEKHIFSHFHGWSYPLLFIDAAEYQEVGKSLQRSKSAGSRYFIESISCTKTFHPKVMFALSDNQALILVGSNNLTWSGYTQSAEVVTPIVVDFERPERAYLLDDFVDFLEGLSDFVGSQTYREHLQEIIHSIPKLNITEERDAWLLHSINKIPLLDQISNVIREPILKISVVSPYFAQDREFYQKMSDLCPDIHIFVQQKTSNLPVKILENFNTFTYHSFLIDNGRFLHAKILFIETDSDNYVFSGSANFSSSALITNANVEMGLLVKGNVQFQEIIKAIGKAQEISLEEVESQTVDSEILGVSPSTMKVVEAVLVGGSIAVTLESLDPALEYTVRLNGEEFSLSYTIDGSTLYFDVNEQILSLFGKSVVLSIVSKNGNELHESNMRIVYNKKIFP
ncbi:phospholipase D family protein, partial [Methanoculleus sp. MH98A]|uniref:phospholipase D family protein n=1 Tax=Methanoculleus sp. MH98A TaxID=1495314 RepID=UPI0012DFAA5E